MLTRCFLWSRRQPDFDWWLIKERWPPPQRRGVRGGSETAPPHKHLVQICATHSFVFTGEEEDEPLASEEFWDVTSGILHRLRAAVMLVTSAVTWLTCPAPRGGSAHPEGASSNAG